MKSDDKSMLCSEHVSSASHYPKKVIAALNRGIIRKKNNIYIYFCDGHMRFDTDNVILPVDDQQMMETH